MFLRLPEPDRLLALSHRRRDRDQRRQGVAVLLQHWELVKAKLGELGGCRADMGDIKSTVSEAVDWVMAKLQPLLNMIARYGRRRQHRGRAQQAC